MMASTFSLLFIYSVVLHLLRRCNGLSLPPKWSHNIAVLCSGNEAFHNKTKQLEDANIIFNIAYLNGKNDSLSFYKTAKTLFDFIDKYGVSLIISDNRHFAFSSIDNLAGHRGIPVIKWYSHGLNLFSQRRNSILYLQPNPSSQVTVIAQLLQKYGWNRIAIVSDNYETNLKMVSSIKAMVEKNVALEIFQNFTIKLGGDFCSILNKIKDNKFRAVVIFSQRVLASTFLKRANIRGLVHLECTWVLGVMHAAPAASHDDVPPELPSEIVELKFSGRRNTSALFDNLMEDSIDLFRNGLTYLEETNASPQDLLKSGCHDDKENFGQNIYKGMRSAVNDGNTGIIQFDRDGYRTNLMYDIIYRQVANQTTPTKSVVIGQFVNGSLNIFHQGWPPTVVAKKLPHGIVLRVSVYEQKPFVMTNLNENCQKGLTCLGQDEKNHCCFGYCIDLLKLLISDLGFKVRLHVVKDGQYGSKNNTTGQWSGLIGELVSGKADMALADLAVNQQRAKVVDFTESFIHTGIGVLVKVNHHDSNNLSGFTEPFTVKLWIVIIILINVVLLCMWMLERLSPYGRRERGKRNKDNCTFSLEETMWFTWSLILSSFEVEIRPKSFGTRCIAVCFSFCLLILITSYTANLAAFLVVEQESYPLSDAGIKDPKLQNPPADFSIGSVKGTNIEFFFKTSEDPLYRRIWRHMRHNGITNLSEGIDQLLLGRLKAVVADYTSITYAASNRKQCDLKVVGSSFVQSGLSIALPKNSSLTSKLSQRIVYYKQYNIESTLKKNWFQANSQKKEGNNVEELSIQSMSGLFLVVGTGVVVAAIIVFLRHCFFQIFKWKRYNISN